MEQKLDVKTGINIKSCKSSGEIHSGAVRKRYTERSYVGLDIFKLFFALCVVAIHTHVTEELPDAMDFWITQGVFRLAVPFFFIASGFLLGKKLQNGILGQVLIEYIKGLLPLLLCVETANGLLEWFLSHLRYGTNFWSWVIVFVKHAFFYPYGAMWFVQACILGAAMLYPFLKKKRLGLALLAGAVLHVWALLCNNYYFIAQATGLDGYVDAYMSLFLSARNGVFVGFFYLALGIKTWQWHQRPFKMRPLVWSLVTCAVAYLLEIWLLKRCSYLDDRALYLTHIALEPTLVLCVLRMKLSISDGLTGLLCRRLSAWIYFSHRLIYVFGRIACFLLLGRDFRGAGAFAVVSALSVLLFVGLYGPSLRL